MDEAGGLRQLCVVLRSFPDPGVMGSHRRLLNKVVMRLECHSEASLWVHLQEQKPLR